MLIEPMTYRFFYIHRVFSIVFKLFPFIAIISPNINSERLMLKAVHTKKGKRQYMSVHILYDVLTLSCKLFPLKTLLWNGLLDTSLFFHLQQTVKLFAFKINLNIFSVIKIAGLWMLRFKGCKTSIQRQQNDVNDRGWPWLGKCVVDIFR